jgi:hypothetical protein
MVTIEAFRPGDEVCVKVPDSPIMRVLAVEGLKARCADIENLQYWFDTVMLERHEPSREHCDMSSTEIYESVSADALPDPDPDQAYSRGPLKNEPIIDWSIDPPSNFWAYAERLLCASQTLVA